MNHVENSKTVAKVVDGASIAHPIDCKGYNHASIDVAYEPASTASAVATVLKLQQSDTDGSYADVTGYVGGTDFTIPTPASTSETVVVRFDVDLKGKKRFLNVASTLTTSGGVASVVRLSKGETGGVKGANAAVSG